MKTELKQQDEIEQKALSRLARKTAKIRDNYLKKMEAKRAEFKSRSRRSVFQFVYNFVAVIVF